MKIVALPSFEKLYPRLAAKKIILTGGCFDILHYGHIRFLREAKKRGEYLIVALESDRFIREHKKREPIHTQRQRAEILAMLRPVDMIILLPFMDLDDDYFRLVRLIKPAVIAVTDGDSQIENKRKQAKEIGAVVEVVMFLDVRFSSSRIISL